MSKLGVVTVTYNSGRVLEPFLDCCEAERDCDWLLFVVDNDSRDRTREILQRRAFPRMRVILNADNLGVAEGNNQGIEAALAAGCERVLLINNDVEFGPDLFRSLLSSLDAHGASALTPQIRYHDEPQQVWYRAGRFKYFWGPDARHVETESSRAGGVYRTEYAPTCCMLIRREVFARIGTMDERYFVYWDDTDFCYRMLKAGLPLLCDSGITMTHKVSSLTGGVQSDFFIKYHHRNQIYYVRKHFGPAVLAYTLVMSVVKAVLRVLVGRDSLRQLRLRLRSMAAGFRVSMGKTADESSTAVTY